jgi:hydroxyacylglutathione hydrolase
MLIKTIPVGQLETNCYVVSDEDTMECAVIDPGDESNAILDYLEDNHLKCRAILITHGHYDHVGAVLPVMEETGAPVYINEKDSGDDYQGGSKLPAAQVGKFYSEGDEVRVGGLTFRVLETPGPHPRRRDAHMRRRHVLRRHRRGDPCGRPRRAGSSRPRRERDSSLRSE